MISNKLLFVVLGLFIAVSAYSQVDYNKVKEVSNTYFIDSIHIYSHELGIQENMQLLIEDGLIKDIGKSISKPYDAIEMKGDSMFAYPAFIDGLSQVGLKKEEDKKEDKVKFPGMPGDERAGVTPERGIEALFSANDKSIKDYRQAGYGLAHIVPKGKMLPGHGSIIVLSGVEDGNPYLKKDFSTFAQFESSRGVFPSTVIGVIAKFKELMTSTKYKLEHAEKYAKMPGVARPQFSKAEEALIPVVQKKEPVYFKTEDHKDISRALKLKNELGFNMVLSDIQQGWMAIERIKSENIPVLLSLKLPKEIKEEKKDTTKLDSPEVVALKERQKKSYMDYINQALAFEKENIPFSFTSLSVKAKDIKKTLERLKETGLKENTIIKALTKNPAKLLGIDHLAGSIEKGKMANLIICTKSLLEKGSKIKWSFVEGHKEEFDVAEKKKKPNGNANNQNILGTWSFASNIMGMDQTGSIIINGNAEDGFTVQIESDDDPGDLEDGTNVSYEDNELLFSMTVDNDGVVLPISFKLSFDGETYEGTLGVGDFGSFPVEGTRTKQPE